MMVVEAIGISTSRGGTSLVMVEGPAAVKPIVVALLDASADLDMPIASMLA